MARKSQKSNRHQNASASKEEYVDSSAQVSPPIQQVDDIIDAVEVCQRENVDQRQADSVDSATATAAGRPIQSAQPPAPGLSQVFSVLNDHIAGRIDSNENALSHLASEVQALRQRADEGITEDVMLKIVDQCVSGPLQENTDSLQGLNDAVEALSGRPDVTLSAQDMIAILSDHVVPHVESNIQSVQSLADAVALLHEKADTNLSRQDFADLIREQVALRFDEQTQAIFDVATKIESTAECALTRDAAAEHREAIIGRIDSTKESIEKVDSAVSDLREKTESQLTRDELVGLLNEHVANRIDANEDVVNQLAKSFSLAQQTAESTIGQDDLIRILEERVVDRIDANSESVSQLANSISSGERSESSVDVDAILELIEDTFATRMDASVHAMEQLKSEFQSHSEKTSAIPSPEDIVGELTAVVNNLVNDRLVDNANAIDRIAAKIDEQREPTANTVDHQELVDVISGHLEKHFDRLNELATTQPASNPPSLDEEQLVGMLAELVTDRIDASSQAITDLANQIANQQNEEAPKQNNNEAVAALKEELDEHLTLNAEALNGLTREIADLKDRSTPEVEPSQLADAISQQIAIRVEPEPTDLTEVLAELSALKNSVAELSQQQPVAIAPAEADSNDSERNEELMLEIEYLRGQITDLESANEALERKLENAPALSESSSGHERMTWEQRKEMMLRQMEDDTFDAEEFVASLPSDTQVDVDPISFVQEMIQSLRERDEQLLDLECELEMLRNSTDQPAGEEIGVTVGAAAIAEMVDSDELLREEREKLQHLQEEWEERFRESEIAASLERAKISRERHELAIRNAELEEQLVHFRRESEQNRDAGGNNSRRWLAKLGLTDVGD